MKIIGKWLDYHILLFAKDLIHIPTGLLHLGYSCPINHLQQCLTSRKFITSLFKREGFVTKGSCPDIPPSPHPSPSRLLKQCVGVAPDFLSDRIVPRPGMRGICPVGLEDGSSYFAGFPLKPSKLTEIQHFLTLGSPALNLVHAHVLLLKHVSWVYFSILGNTFFSGGLWGKGTASHCWWEGKQVQLGCK